MTTARYLVGDVFDRMAGLPDGSVDLVMTSPPFLALRSYLPEGHPDKHKEIGSEATPAEFLDTLLALTAEWGRLLAPHGSICVELGDTYAGSGGAGGDYGAGGLRDGQERFDGTARRTRQHNMAQGYSGYSHGRNTKEPGYGYTTGGTGWPLDKSLCGIPTLYAWSLAYGRNLLTGEESPAGRWRVRNLVAWVRPNPPVGALGDKFRPATSYLTIATRARDRYFDLDAVRTPAQPQTPRNTNGLKGGRVHAGEEGEVQQFTQRIDSNPAGAPPLDWWNHVDTLIDDEIRQRAGKPNDSHPETGSPKDRAAAGSGANNAMANRTFHARSGITGAQGSHIRRRLERAGYLGGPSDDVWDIAPTGFAGAHYAVYPPELCVRPILAMTPQRVCTTCGQPSRRIVEKPSLGSVQQGPGRNGKRVAEANEPATTVGWSDCGHGTWRPGHVLDPFAGSGTTLAVATGHGREATGIDLDPRNAHLARDRCGMFLTIDEAVVS